MPGKDHESLALEIDDDLIAAALASVENIQKRRPVASPEDDGDDDGEDGDTFDLDAEIEVDLEGLDDEDEDGLDDEGGLSQLAEAEILRLEAEKAELTEAHTRAQEEVERLRKELLRGKALVQRARERLERTEEGRLRSEEGRRTAEESLQQQRAASEKLTAQLRHVQERRRQEQEESRKFGNSRAILEIRPVLDNLALATSHAEADPQVVLKGVQMVVSQFHAALQHLGVSLVDARVGQPFQPEIHEAMLYTPTAEQPPGQVLREIASGYLLHGRLLRAARVAVSAPLPVAEVVEQAEATGATEQETVQAEMAEEEPSAQGTPEIGAESSAEDAGEE